MNRTFNATAGTETIQQRSPVPYLFLGLASMIALVAMALLALACSYWNCFRYLEGNRQRDVENPHHKTMGQDLEEKVVVIMPGESNPTFLANLISSEALSSFTDQGQNSQSHLDPCPPR